MNIDEYMQHCTYIVCKLAATMDLVKEMPEHKAFFMKHIKALAEEALGLFNSYVRED